MPKAQQKENTYENFPAAQTVRAALTAVHAKIIELIRAWSQPKERYAELRSKARTPAAHGLIARVREDIEELERKSCKRVRNRRAKSGAKFSEAIERFVGDLLRAKTGTTAPARIYHALGKSSFKYDPVKYDMCMTALEGLKALQLVGQRKGQTSYRKTEFDPGDFVSVTRPGYAARFWPGAVRNVVGIRWRDLR